MAAKGSKLKKIYIVVSAALVLIVPCLVMDREDGNLLVRGGQVQNPVFEVA